MNQEVQKFINTLKTDKALQEKMQAATAKFMAEPERDYSPLLPKDINTPDIL